MQEWRLCRNAAGAKVEAHLPTDSQHCGVCGNACGPGVSCVEGDCNYSTRIHCGGPGRTCIGFEAGVDVDCVYVGDTDFDPALGPVVRGYTCAPVASVPVPPVEDPATPPVGEDVVEPVEQVIGDPPLEPDWILVPGRSTNCRDRVDRSCYFTAVEVRDACGHSCTAQIEHDFELMTTEMSRAMYRDKVLRCTCIGPEPPRCAELCTDDTDAEALPVTGLSWCEAYEACQAVGGRLPTMIERARVEAMVDVDRGLFTRTDVCGEWFDTVGSAPMVAECFDWPEELALDRVDGLEGAVPIGTEVLPEPRRFHHLFGNADEWLADSLERATCEVLTQSGPWGEAETNMGERALRLARGRSLYSPAGEAGDRNVALDPSARSDELGVRCARTSVETAPVPYDATVDPRIYARCHASTTGYRAVRDAVGDRVYRATQVCIDGTNPEPTQGDLLQTLVEQAMTGENTALVRHPLAYEGPPVEVGQAVFSGDEQWWLNAPAIDPGERLFFAVEGSPIELLWQGEYRDFDSACAERMETETEGYHMDGRLVLGQRFIVEQDTLLPFVRGGDPAAVKQLACSRLDCAQPAELAGPCEAECEAWWLPVVVDFKRVEARRSELCGPPQ